MFHVKPRVVAVVNQKGGVGKTTTAINLGAAVAAYERRTLLIDLDPQGNCTSGLGGEPEPARGRVWSEHQQLGRGLMREDAPAPMCSAHGPNLATFSESSNPPATLQIHGGCRKAGRSGLEVVVSTWVGAHDQAAEQRILEDLGTNEENRTVVVSDSVRVETGASKLQSPADIGAYGGPGAGSWDLDGDTHPCWWHPGPYDSSVDPEAGWDCDDLDPDVGPDEC